MPARSPRHDRLEDVGWLAERRADGWTVQRITRTLGVAQAAVRAALQAAGLPARLPRPGPRWPELYDQAWVVAQLQTMTRTELAARLGCSLRSVRDAARRARVPATRRTGWPAELHDRDELARRLRIQTAAQIGADLGCSDDTVKRAVQADGLQGVARRRRRFVELDDGDWLLEQLRTRRAREVAAIVGCSPEAVWVAARRHRQESGSRVPSTGSGSDGLLPRHQAPMTPAGAVERRQRAPIRRARLEALLATGGAARAAQELRVTPRTIRNHAHLHGIALPRARQRRERARRLGDPAWLRSRYVDNGSSVSEIAADLHCATADVAAALSAAGIEQRRPGVRYRCLHESGWLQGRFDAGATIGQVAAEVGCSRSHVRRVARQLDARPHRTRRYRRPEVLDDHVWLQRRYVDERRSIRSLAEELHVAQATVANALRRASIDPRRPGGATRIGDYRYPRLHQPGWLAAQAAAGATCVEVAAEIGASVVHVRTVAASLGVRWRP